MTRKEMEDLAATATERTNGYARAALSDPAIKAAVHSRYVPHVLPGAEIANDQRKKPAAGRKRA